MSALSDLMGVLLPGGIAVGGTLVFQAVRSWREGKTSREETVLQRWQRLLNESEDDAREARQAESYERDMGHYWRQRAADLEHLVRTNGLDVPPLPPRPERRVRVTSGAARRRRTREANAPDEDT